MNANEISPKANARLERIQKVSANLRAFFHISAVAVGIAGIWQIIIGLIYHQPGSVGFWRLLLYHQTYQVNFQANFFNEFALNGCITFTWAVGAWFAFKLFFLYARGELFSAEIVHCIRRIGFVSILLGVERLFPLIITTFRSVAYTVNSDSTVSSPYLVVWGLLSLPLLSLLSKVIPGIAIVVVAWIMDEGRKIQEEQELTV